VYRWEGGPALVQTVDFFTPIVDDPYVYGQIAAANALSDVYAMGGTPLTALAVAAFPTGVLDPGTIQAIFRGGLDKLREAGVSLLGGHTVQDQEIKFGYAVTGAIDPARVLTNAGAAPGDELFLTKPLGTGIVGTAIKFGRAPAALQAAAVRSMCTLNRAAAETLRALEPGLVHACTDITGFGLLGHASEMAAASGVVLAIDAHAVPTFEGAADLALENRSAGLESNRAWFGTGVELAGPVDEGRLAVLFDPQTSGGLLLAVASGAGRAVARALADAGVAAARIGGVVPGRGVVRVVVRP